MQYIENHDLIKESAMYMDKIAARYCPPTLCNDNRMKSVHNENNCEWYHGSWLYCRLVGIVVSNDYLGQYYKKFFRKCKSDKINILLCGLADYAILGHLLRRIPSNIFNKINLYVVDLCSSPLKLCEWYINKIPAFSKYKQKIKYIKADATKLPFDSDTFDLITSYSFLTRMIYSESIKITNEWNRILKKSGQVITTIHITDNDSYGNFYRSKSENENIAIHKINKYIRMHNISPTQQSILHNKVHRYISNIMSSALSEDNVYYLFRNYKNKIIHFNQPGELEKTHKMIIVQATKM